MWSKAKNGLVQPSKQGRTSPLFLLRKREISRDFARKKKIGGSVEPPILVSVKHCVKLGVYARRVANKTSRSGERGRRRQNLRCPPPSHSRCASVDRLPPSAPCFRRFRYGKNSYQLFLPCYPTTPSMPSMTALGLTE